MSIYDEIEAEAQARFPERYARDTKLQEIIREGREIERRQAARDRGTLRFALVVVLVALVAIGLQIAIGGR